MATTAQYRFLESKCVWERCPWGVREFHSPSRMAEKNFTRDGPVMEFYSSSWVRRASTWGTEVAVSRMMTCPHDGEGQGSKSFQSRQKTFTEWRDSGPAQSFRLNGEKGWKGQSSANRFQKVGESIHTEYWVRNGDRAMSAMGDELYGKIHWIKRVEQILRIIRIIRANIKNNKKTQTSHQRRRNEESYSEYYAAELDVMNPKLCIRERDNSMLSDICIRIYIYIQTYPLALSNERV